MLIHDQLLATKFAIPTSSNMLLARPRLMALLDEGLRRQLTLVSAPAGFGKTTLLAEWQRALAATNRLNAWITLDKGDNYLRDFWKYILTALDKCQPGISKAALEALLSPQKPHIEYVLSIIINAIAGTSPTWSLILDDYHVITDPEIQASLTFLLDHLPTQMHLVLATRIDPPLPLPRLRARGQLLEVRADQLRCTQEEATQYLTQVIGLSLPNHAYCEDIARTEGWLVGLQLMGLWLKGQSHLHKKLKELHGDHRYILDYLIEEVLQQQPEQIQAFLLQTSILEPLNASLCDAVLAQTGSQQMLEYLERANLFIVALDEHRHWYRYHALFSEALRYQLERRATPQITTLHLRASQWYAQEGNIDEAIRHALLAREWQWAADLLEPITQTLLWKRCELPTVWNWLQQLPNDILRSRPYLSLAYAMILFLTAPHAETATWLQAAQETLQSPSRTPTAEAASQFRDGRELLGEINTLEAIITSYQGNDMAALDLCYQAHSHLPTLSHEARATIFLAQSLAYFAQGYAIDATYCALKAFEFAQATDDIPGAICHLCIASYYLTLRGQLQEAYRILQKAALLVRAPGGFSCSALMWVDIYQAEIQREWNQIEQALQLTSQEIPREEQIELLILRSTRSMLLARLYLSHEEPEAANQALQQAISSSLPRDSSDLRAWMLTVEQVRVWLVQGDLERAASWVQELTWRERPRSLFAREREEVARVRVLLAQHQAAEALERLTPLQEQACAAERWGNVIEILILQALAYHMHQEEIQAISVLVQAIHLAEPQGYIRIFVDEGSPMRALLSKLRTIEQKPCPYLDKVLAAFPPTDPSVQANKPFSNNKEPLAKSKEEIPARMKPPALVESLSARELEVLQLMRQGKSNQEIAQELVIATNTAKRHVSNIFIKLGVNSRLQAVNQAHELGLI